MLEPKVTTRRFDRGIFTKKAAESFLRIDNARLLFFYTSGIVVAEVDGEVSGNAYLEFQRSGFVPVQIWHNGLDYCGWVKAELVEVLS